MLQAAVEGAAGEDKDSARAENASAQNAKQKLPTKEEFLVIIRNAQNAGR